MHLLPLRLYLDLFLDGSLDDGEGLHVLLDAKSDLLLLIWGYAGFFPIDLELFWWICEGPFLCLTSLENVVETHLTKVVHAEGENSPVDILEQWICFLLDRMRSVLSVKHE